MQIDIRSWKLGVRDHMWLERTDANEYEDKYSCDGCGSQMVEVARVESVSGGAGLVTGICEECGYTKRVRNLSSKWYDEHFSKKWLKGTNDSISDQQILQENTYVFDKVKNHLNPSARVLDAGCGIGQRLLAFKNNGFHVYGFDPSEHRTASASIALPNLQVSSAEDYFLQENLDTQFDFIYFFNVLQFVADPFYVLKLSASRLRDGGLLYFSVGRYYSDANFCQFSHLGVIRSFLSLFCLKETLEQLDLWPIEHTDEPFELLLQKGRSSQKSQKILENSKKVLPTHLRAFARRSLKSWRLGLFGQSEIKYLDRKIAMTANRGFTFDLPVVFMHDSDDPLILLK